MRPARGIVACGQRRGVLAGGVAQALQEVVERLQRGALRVPTELRADPRRIHERRLDREVEPPGRGRLKPGAPRHGGGRARQPGRHGDRQRLEPAGDRAQVEWCLGGDVVGAAGLRVQDGQAVCLREICAVDGLEADAAHVGQERDDAGSQEAPGQERPGEQAPDLLGGPPLEDEGRAQAHNAQLRVGGLDRVERPLGGHLVDGVERRGDPVGRPPLVDAGIVRPWRVRPDGGRVDERADPGARSRREDAGAAVHVDRARQRAIAGWLDRPREMDDRVGTGEERVEVVSDDVGHAPLGLGHLELRLPPGHAGDRGDGGLGGQVTQQRDPVVARGPDDDDAHGRRVPGPRAS